MPVNYTFTFYRNHTSSDTTDYSYTKSVSTMIAPTIDELGWAAPQGYQFKEWNTYRDGTGVIRHPGVSVSNGSWYAIWELEADPEPYIATDTELTSIANAIRTKGGTNSQLEFPSGFVSAIGAITAIGDVTQRTSSDLTASGATVTAPAGYYASAASKSVSSGTAGTPTATKGSVSNHAISVTPSVTNTTGYITGSTKTGTAVSVAASELVSGTLNVTANGTADVTNYASASVNVPASAVVSGSLSITENDTYDVTNYASAVVSVGGGTLNYSKQTDGITSSTIYKRVIIPNVSSLPIALIVDTSGGSAFPWL